MMIYLTHEHACHKYTEEAGDTKHLEDELELKRDEGKTFITDVLP